MINKLFLALIPILLSTPSLSNASSVSPEMHKCIEMSISIGMNVAGMLGTLGTHNITSSINKTVQNVESCLQ
jgi:hypothetical protein